ncbi:hypothetical protein BGZ63DRAFT_402499 [Mariannaea sp. PMI_226]|nr:hypothetical protein BGZ63DRAFT_402499 [Mariannaea sp. PMI_226]
MEEGIAALIDSLEPEIEDPEEETFLLFSQQIPSLNLGFIDPRASTIEVTVDQKDYTIHQSPSILSSNRAGGTTGAVIWKITPTFASWLASPSNPLFTCSNLSASSSVLELGCGISPLSALGLSSRIARYVLTDQPYVQRLLQRNLEENLPSSGASSSANSSRSRGKKRRATTTGGHGTPAAADIRFVTLDWETDEVTPSLTGSDQVHSFDAVVACDCVYNQPLVAPFVQTCADACRLRTRDSSDEATRPCLCVIGQQLRNDDVFETWLKAFHTSFHVWRVPDAALPKELQSTAGFVVHVGVLRQEHLQA